MWCEQMCSLVDFDIEDAVIYYAEVVVQDKSYSLTCYLIFLLDLHCKQLLVVVVN